MRAWADPQNRTGIYGVTLFCIVTTFFGFGFMDTPWYVPLCLIVWSGLCLSRLFALSVTFEYGSLRLLPQKLLYFLGIAQQEEREATLARIFFFPPFLLLAALAGFYLAFSFSVAGTDSLPLAVQDFWGTVKGDGAQGNIIAPHTILANANFPVLLGLIFFLAVSYAGDKRGAQIATLTAALFYLTYSFFPLLRAGEGGAESPAFLLRAQAGGFWYASLPYLMGAAVLGAPLHALAQGFKGAFIPFVVTAATLFSMGVTDLYERPGALSSCLCLTGWMIGGFCFGMVAHETGRATQLYVRIKESLDFGTKIEQA